MQPSQTKATVKASDDFYGEVEVIEDPNDNFFVCSDGHPKVRMFTHEECRICYGEDEYGHDFCPVCEYCCGC